VSRAVNTVLAEDDDQTIPLVNARIVALHPERQA
jgi:hypothetical protein